LKQLKENIASYSQPRRRLPNLAASRDGRTLFYAQVEFENNMISMVENFQ